jgi:hypothetical protein
VLPRPRWIGNVRLVLLRVELGGRAGEADCVLLWASNWIGNTRLLVLRVELGGPRATDDCGRESM